MFIKEIGEVGLEGISMIGSFVGKMKEDFVFNCKWKIWSRVLSVIVIWFIFIIMVLLFILEFCGCIVRVGNGK